MRSTFICMSAPEHIHDVLQKLEGEREALKREDLRQQLKTYINHLILNDFNRLVQLLYRVDVEEKKLKQLLKAEPGKDAATLITNLIIERQQKKKESRETPPAQDLTSEEELW